MSAQPFVPRRIAPIIKRFMGMAQNELSITRKTSRSGSPFRRCRMPVAAIMEIAKTRWVRDDGGYVSRVSPSRIALDDLSLTPEIALYSEKIAKPLGFLAWVGSWFWTPSRELHSCSRRLQPFSDAEVNLGSKGRSSRRAARTGLGRTCQFNRGRADGRYRRVSPVATCPAKVP